MTVAAIELTLSTAILSAIATSLALGFRPTGTQGLLVVAILFLFVMTPVAV